ncbi:sensor histidine kinase [Microlunatus soli]|uniref:Two-component system, NarL family, sensor histidine kinase DesK n=1 Tax=Microlunatus soli TaxID=630515 RepID=A0A1H1WM62_9ACTN|nr:histidine kinase [Microlunatus soli]SDS97711.1 two-component system, NarL family, sensor histidine kinase DesK [Microlunatus soli]
MRSTLHTLLRVEPFAEGEDPDRAPTARCGPEAARRWTPRRFLQNQGTIYLFGLVFMIFAVQDIHAGQPTGTELAYRWIGLVGMSLTYLMTAWAADLRLLWRWAYIGLFVALMLSTIGYAGWGFTNFGVYPSVMIATLIPWRHARWAVLAWNLVVLLTAIPQWSLAPVVLAALGLLFGIAVGGGFEAGRVRHRLQAAEQRVSTLAVAAERERIARDLHDILGHSLTAISIKSGLAARLSEADPGAAREQMTEVEQIARVALADVRATTTGMREVRLASEIASSRSVLMAAGIEATVPSALPPMADAESQLLGFVVREVVTNVVRHAEATRCTIEVHEEGVTITDDGVGMPRVPRRGTGLTGLRRRVADAGGVLVVRPAEGGGTVVRAVLTAPRSAPGRTEPARPEPARTEPARPERSRLQPARPERVVPETARPGPNADPALPASRLDLPSSARTR